MFLALHDWVPLGKRNAVKAVPPERAARYQVMFGATRAFLPERNGIRPNTLHVILHIVTLATLAVLGALAALAMRGGFPIELG